MKFTQVFVDEALWSFSIFSYSADLNLQAHNNAEPRPYELEQPEITTQDCMVHTKHDGCLTLHDLVPLLQSWCQTEIVV